MYGVKNSVFTEHFLHFPSTEHEKNLCIFLLTAGIKTPRKWDKAKCHRLISSLLPVDVLNLRTEFPFEPSKEQSVSDRSLRVYPGFWNHGNFCFWNPESRIFCGFRNPWSWNPGYSSRNPESR